MPCGLRNGAYMVGRRTAASARDIDQPLPEILLHLHRHGLRRFFVFACEVRQAGIGIDRYRTLRDVGHPFEVGQQLPRPERTVKTDGQRPGMRDRCVECLDGLSGERPSAVGERSRHDEGKLPSARGEDLPGGEYRRLAVERVEKGLELDDVRAAVHQPLYLRSISGNEPFEIDLAARGVVHVRGDGGGFARRPHRTAHEPWPRLRMLPHVVVRRPSGHLCRSAANRIRMFLQAVIGERNAVRIERIGRNDVGTRLQIGAVYLPDDLRPGKGQQIVAPFQREMPRCELLAPVLLFPQAVPLYHGTHTAVEDDNPLPDNIV